jgi:histidinol-phosphate aminotransferase
MNGLMLNSQLLQVPLYVAGKSPEQVCQELGLSEAIKLGSNENPLGPSPMALTALRQALTEAHRYPGIAEGQLRRKLAAYYGDGLTQEHFIIGSGGTDVLRMVAQAFISEGVETITCRVTFPLFALLTTMYGGKTIRVEPRPDYHFDLPAMADAVTDQTRIVWLCSPNNPTGFILSTKEVDEFFERLPDHVVVVFDEAYCDFVTAPDYAKGIRYVRQGRNVVVVRSFSKGAGLANLRVGYGIARPDLAEYLLHTVLPFNTGALACVAAAASLDDYDFSRRSRDLVVRERALLYTHLSEMGLNCLPGHANFLLVVDPPLGAPALTDALLREGVIVRPMGGFGLPNALRVTIGLPGENQRFLAAMRTALSEALVLHA